MLNLYLVCKLHSIYDHGFYDFVVVAAETEDLARRILPTGVRNADSDTFVRLWDTPDKLEVHLLGQAVPGTEQEIIVESWLA